MAKGKYVAYVGTYTHERSIGIHLYDLDAESGALTKRKVVPINNPSDLIISNNKKFLYSIEDEGVAAFGIMEDGDLDPINENWIGGMRGCYIEIDDLDRYLFIGGYHDGRVSMMKLNEDGSIGEIADGVFHKGLARSVSQRNHVPHVTCVKLTPDQQFLCAVDSGLDQVKIYRVDYEEGRIELADILRCNMDSSPRMIRFGRNSHYAYVLCEMDNCIDVYHYSVENNLPVFEKIQTVATLDPKEDSTVCAASGMEISHNGRYLYCSNAGINTAAVFEIDELTGKLTMVCENSISGDYPKVIGIYPSDDFFMSLNHETDEITTFKVDFDNKTILMRGKPIHVNTPNCVYIHKIS